MLRNYFLLNIILVAVACLLGYRLYGVLSYSMEMPAGPVRAAAEKEETPAASGEKVLDASRFDVITGSDIFRPSRTPARAETPLSERPAPKDPPKVFGTVILGGSKTAILEDPVTRSTKTYGINDTVAGYKITDILEDRVVYSLEGERVEVRLREDKGIQPNRQPSASQPVQRLRPVVNRPAVSRMPRRVPRPVPPIPGSPVPGNPPPPVPENGADELERAIEENQQ